MELPILRVRLPSSGEALWKHPHEHTQRCVSQVTPKTAKLALKINHHSDCPLIVCLGAQGSACHLRNTCGQASLAEL